LCAEKTDTTEILTLIAETMVSAKASMRRFRLVATDSWYCWKISSGTLGSMWSAVGTLAHSDVQYAAMRSMTGTARTAALASERFRTESPPPTSAAAV
jgi:hypothetical protein